MSIALAILAIGFLIFLHELGHLGVARWMGLPAERFSIGMGPVVWRRRAWGVEWALSAIPFGGYVMFDAESAPWQAASPWQRIGVSLAGPAVNVLAAVVLYVGAASLALGSLDLAGGWERTVTAAGQVFQVLGMLFSGRVGVDDLAGPVHMVSIGSELAADTGRFLAYLGFISINLAVFNLLPIPALDGGQVLITLGQAAVGRPLSERAQQVVFGGSYLFLFGLITWVMVQDVVRIITS